MPAADPSTRVRHGPSVLIVDDEPLARRFLSRLLARDGGVGDIRQCANGLEARAEIMRAPPDILFLDVEMPGLSGDDLLGSLSEAPVTIFTTAYSRHAIRAFELAACDYLLKPFDEARFATALKRAKAALEATRRERGGARLSVRVGDRTVLYPADQVIAVSSEDNYVHIHVDGRVFLQRSTLAAVEWALRGSDIVRVHRRFLVNMMRVRAISATGGRGLQLTLCDGSTVPVSRRYRDRVRAVIA